MKEALSGHISEYATHTQATHVLQKMIAQFPSECLPYVFDPVLENLLELCNDQNGLCVVNLGIMGRLRRLYLTSRRRTS